MDTTKKVTKITYNGVNLPIDGGGSGSVEYLMLKPITEIRGDAFYSLGLTSVIIPNTVTSIGDYAFYGNQLTSVTIGNGLTNIEPGVFQNNQLTSVTIPDSVTSIGWYAFAENQLTSVTIPDSVTNIGLYAFQNNQLTSVTIPNSVTHIESSAFFDNQLTSVVWETTAEILSRTFEGTDNKITSFTITSDSLVSLQNINAFSGVTAMTVYVQPQLIEDYKVATNWSLLYNEGKCDFVDIALAPIE